MELQMGSGLLPAPKRWKTSIWASLEELKCLVEELKCWVGGSHNQTIGKKIINSFRNSSRAAGLFWKAGNLSRRVSCWCREAELSSCMLTVWGMGVLNQTGQNCSRFYFADRQVSQLAVRKVTVNRQVTVAASKTTKSWIWKGKKYYRNISP